MPAFLKKTFYSIQLNDIANMKRILQRILFPIIIVERFYSNFGETKCCSLLNSLWLLVEVGATVASALATRAGAAAFLLLLLS